MLYVPIVPEGHNQPIPGSKVPTARLSEDELAAMRHRFKVEPADFLVILIGKDGEEKLSSRTPVAVEQIERLIDSMPMRKSEMRQEPQGEEIGPPAPSRNAAISRRTTPHRLTSKEHREVP